MSDQFSVIELVVISVNCEGDVIALFFMIDGKIMLSHARKDICIHIYGYGIKIEKHKKTT